MKGASKLLITKGFSSPSLASLKVSWPNIFLLAAFYLSMVNFAVYRVYWTPPVLPLDSAPELFSEARAFEHVFHLAKTIGNRQVSQPGLELAAEYLLAQGAALQKLASARNDIKLVIDREQASGAFEFEFVHTPFITAYQNVTNIIFSLVPENPEAQKTKAVLLNAHFDSTLGSPGASDDASGVGIMLEIIRVMVSDPTIQLAAPLLFLFNGAEEPLLHGSHGFITQSKWWGQAGAFINLESTGPGGPDVLFQHSGAWTVDAYARAAKYPRGSILGQDFFDAGILIADTDYSIFSFKGGLGGTLPGVDIAFLLDAGAYHTPLDIPERIRPGTLQAMGENTLALAQEFAKFLQSDPEIAASKSRENSVYFDVFGYFMVSYPFHYARLLHNIPLALMAAAPLLIGTSSKRLIWQYRTMIGQGLLSLGSVLLTVIFSALAGILRVLISGAPMAGWYSNNFLAYCIYFPAGLAGAVLPYILLPSDLHSALLGNALSFSFLASMLVAVGAGTGVMGAAWPFVVLISLMIPFKVQGGTPQLVWTLFLSLVPLTIVLPVACSFPTFILGKVSMAGAFPAPFGVFLADVFVGLVFGSVVMGVSGPLAVWLAYSCGRRAKTLVVVLLATSAAFAAYASVPGLAYTPHFPKRVIIQHHHQHTQEGVLERSSWKVSAVDSVPVTVAVPEGLYKRIENNDSDWMVMWPISRVLQGVSFEAPPPEPISEFLPLPRLELLQREHLESEARDRVFLDLVICKPSWPGSFNFTGGPILGWSFTDSLPTLPLQVADKGYVVRFAGNEGSEHWKVWVEVPHGAGLHVEIAVSYQDETPIIKRFTAALPEWAAPVAVTTFQSVWDF